MIPIESILAIVSVLIIASIVIAKFSDNIGVPSLLLFLGVGMLAGSDGPGNIFFENIELAQTVGIIALIFILFSGGLDTNWSKARSASKDAILLATLGVLFTTAGVGLFAHYFLDFGLIEGFLLGSIISSTDAAAVFSVLRSRSVKLKGNLKPMLELESGSNDPLAVFLTITCIELLMSGDTPGIGIIGSLILQMGIGGLMGYYLGKGAHLFINKFRLSYNGFYPVFLFSITLFIYGSTTLLGGSGFLAVYIAGLVLGNNYFIHKKSLMRFFDGLAWLGQIVMFITLGLLAYPSRIIPVAETGIIVALFLIFIARPVSVFLTLMFSKYNIREKVFVSWVGLRGAVPIILATFPLMSGLGNSEYIFNIVFFIVLLSALLQGWTIPIFSKALKLEKKEEKDISVPLKFVSDDESGTQLVEYIIAFGSPLAGKSIVDIKLPEESLIVLICRDEKFIVPSGGTHFKEGDVLQILVSGENIKEVFDALK